MSSYLNNVQKQFARGQEAKGQRPAFISYPAGEDIISGDWLKMNADGSVGKVSGASDKIIGFAEFQLFNIESNVVEIEALFPEGKNVPVVNETSGHFFDVDVDVIPTDSVYINLSTGNLTNTSNSNANPLVKGAFFTTPAKAGEKVVVQRTIQL